MPQVEDAEEDPDDPVVAFDALPEGEDDEEGDDDDDDDDDEDEEEDNDASIDLSDEASGEVEQGTPSVLNE